MAEDLTTAEKWNRKGTFLRKILNDHVDDVNKKQMLQPGQKKNKKPYRGPEHDWYGAWNSTWASFCEDTFTLLPAPQPRITSFVSDANKKVKQELIPDFGILRVIGPRNELNRACRKIGPAGRKKWVALQEIKPPPAVSSTRDGVMHGLQEAREDLLKQVRLLFGRDRSRQKAVIGIYAAGNWWAWQLFTPDDFKPLSKNKDSTFRSSEEPEGEGEANVPIWCFYKLESEESDEAMSDMLEAIRGLPGFDVFGNLL